MPPSSPTPMAQLPWLMIHHNPTMDGIDLFLDIWESKVHKFHLPETINMWCLASCHGWLLLMASKGQEVLLLNPLTRARIQLPPFSTELIYPSFYRHNASLYDFLRHTTSKVTFSSDLTDPNCLIVVFHHGMKMIHICRVGEPCWTDVTGSPLHSSELILDTTYYNGRLYLLYQGAMEISEANKPEERIVCNFEPELRYVILRFLKRKSGIYVVDFHLNIYQIEKPLKTTIELYQFQEQSLKLKQIPDTNNMAIFIGWDNFFLALCSDDWDLVDYVGGNYIDVRASSTEPYYHIRSTKLDNGKSDVVCNLDEEDIDSLIWFQPSFV